MKKISFAVLVASAMLSMNAFADSDAYNGFSLAYVQSSQNGVSDSTTGVAIMRSVRSTERYGYEMQFGFFGKVGSYTSNGFVDLSGLGVLPLGGSNYKLYGKAGLADVYSRGDFGSANHFGLTYGLGIETRRDIGKIRVGFQHINVGNGTLSPVHSTSIFALTLFLK